MATKKSTGAVAWDPDSGIQIVNFGLDRWETNDDGNQRLRHAAGKGTGVEYGARQNIHIEVAERTDKM
jgi:uncharacterized protein YfiM (DUF2279 family)